MHPVITFEVHRREQAEALDRLALMRRREAATRPDNETPGRPPDPRGRRAALRATSTAALWVPTLGHMAP